MTSNKGQMLEKTRKLIEETASQGAKIVALTVSQLFDKLKQLN